MSIKFHIPEPYILYDINNMLLQIKSDHPEIFYDDIDIASVHGVPGHSIWNGGRITTQNAAVNIDEIQSMVSTYNSQDIAIRYTFTNSLIEEKHLSDPYSNKLMQLANNGQNEVLINSPILEKYLRDRYPDFKYIASTTLCERDINKINEMTEIYDLVVVDWRDNHDADFLEKIKQPEKIELLVNECCGVNCPRRKQHYEAVSKTNLFISGSNIEQFYNDNIGCDSLGCKYQTKGLYKTITENPSAITVKDIYTVYAPMGFKNFKISGRNLGAKWSFLSYMYYLIKPEYWLMFLEVIIPIQ